MRKIVIYVVVGSDAGEALEGLRGIKVVRVHEEEREAECQQTFK